MKLIDFFRPLILVCMLDLSLTAPLIAASCESVQNGIAGEVVLIDDSNATLQARIDRVVGHSYESVKSLIVKCGVLTAEDCRFIKTSLLQLENLEVIESANFQHGVIPKTAFSGHPALRSIRADLATIVESKAFSLCEKLEAVNLPAVEEIQVQAFAQAKGSSAGRLREVHLPALKRMAPRVFYYCTQLEELYLASVPQAERPVGKEGLWFERVTQMAIHVPNRAIYEEFVKAENCVALDWSAFNFVADNGDPLPKIELADAYDDSAYEHLRQKFLPTFDKSEKDFSGTYYTGDFKLSLNLYTFNMNINAWMNNSSSAPHLSTLDAIRWAAKAGFDAVDVTCYYIPGYSNTAMPTKSEEEILAYARQIKKQCKKLGIEISGTGLQNNFADPSQSRREMDVERIKFWIKVAAEMGAPVIRIFAGPPPADIRREGWEKIACERMVPHIQEVARWAAEHYPQVRIGLQNHGGMLSTANQVIQVLKWIDCENVGIINDTGFYRDFLSTDARAYDWYRDIALVLPYSNNFQIKKKPAGAETEELMDLKRLLWDIRKSPYRGYLPIELLWVGKDEGYPGKLETPPYEETLLFLKQLKQAIKETSAPVAKAPETAVSPLHGGKILGINSGEIVLLEGVTAAELCEELSLQHGNVLRATHPNGLIRGDIEQICEGDRIEIHTKDSVQCYVVRLKRYELTNLALNPAPSRIKRSSFRGNAPVANAFDGRATGNSGTGYQVDPSQATTPGRETFWLALDLGSEERIDAFGVAWGTAVGQLRTRLKEGRYRVAYTNDPAKWQALSNAQRSGKNGYAEYAAPIGWKVVFEQDANLLPDANGNKVFTETLKTPIKARYVMITGELAGGGVEIYNFFVFKRQLLAGATSTASYPTYDSVRIRPDYLGMTLAPGRPALVRLGTISPSYVLMANKPVTISGRLVDPDGEELYAMESITLLAGTTFRMEPKKEIYKRGTYRVEFSINDGEQHLHDAYYFTAIDEEVFSYTYARPYPAFRCDVSGGLVYLPDYRGNCLMDYSHAGYGGGGVKLPDAPVRIALEPSADNLQDDTKRIQRAVDMLGRYPADQEGIRGAILLKAGTYRISEPIRIDCGGIVIRGEGDGHEQITTHDQPLSPTTWFDYARSEHGEQGITKVVATWKSDSYNKNMPLFNISGGDVTIIGEEIAITDQYVPVGSRRLHLASVEGLSVGDNLRICRKVGAAWAQDLKMDVITDAPGILSENQWVTNGKLNQAYRDIVQERTIAAIDPETKSILLVEPIVDPLDRKYGISTVARFSAERRVSHSGIENLQLISRFDKHSTATNTAFGITYKYYDDECHAQVGIRIGNAEDIWVRRVTTYHLDVATTIAGGTRRITLQDISCLEPVSGTGGERRYSFSNSGGAFVLNQRNYARYTRHGFIVMGNVMGPNVFLKNRTDYQFDANEPHLRWSAGGLYDNVKGRIYVQNRWNNGTAHGWSGANYTLYNCEGKFIISQNPLVANYLFGHTSAEDRLPFVMEEVDPGNVPNYTAHEYHLGSPMKPQSLYLRQLRDRLGEEAVVMVNDPAIPPVKDVTAGFYESFAFLESIQVDGLPLKDFHPEIFEYEIPVALDAVTLPVIGALGASEVSVERHESEKRVTFVASKKGCISNTYTIRYHIVSRAPISGSGNERQLAHLTDGDPKTSWSASGSPYVQFYLGDTPQPIREVSLGYCRNTQSRRQYYFDFEISNDGYNWTKVENKNWETDNLGRGHIMGMQLNPGVGNTESDYETFTFPAGIKARLLRVCMYGARFGRGSGTTNANAYWAIDVKCE